MTFHYIDVNNVTLHYAQAGNGHHLIVFLHGFPEFWHEYKNQLHAFSESKEYVAVAPDMRGYNLSSKPLTVEEYKTNILVEDIRQFIEKLGHQKCTLVAHDWGGIVAWLFAIAYPKLLHQLIIINSPHPAIFQRELSINPLQQKASGYMYVFSSAKAEDILSHNHYEALVNIVLKEGLQSGIFNHDDKKAYIQAWSQPGALTGALNYYRAAEKYGYGLESDNYMVHVPTLVIWGEKDKAILISNLIGLEQFVPQLTIKRIPDATHWVIHEKPDLVNRYITEFLQLSNKTTL